MEKLASRELNEKQKAEIAQIIAVAAIKYSILKQVTSSDIVYDAGKSISFEGDSGPYLLYTAVRAQSILEKAKREKIKPAILRASVETNPLVRHLTRFPEVIARAAGEKAPHHVATYLIELSSLFNAWYAQTQIVNKDDEESPYKIAITQAVRIVLENGLKMLGMKVPEKM